MIFRCWDPGTFDEDDGITIEALDARDAAERFAEKRFAMDSYPMQRDVCVKAKGASDHETFEVETRQEPVFIARKARR